MRFLSLLNLLRLWRARLSTPAMLIQEALAVVGIAVGVALLFASQVASTSLSGSVQQLSKEVIGSRRQLQVLARGPNGFSELLTRKIADLQGVENVAPVLEESAKLIGPKGSQGVDLLGTTPEFASAGGTLVRRLHIGRLSHIRAIALPQPISERIGANPLEPIRAQIGARTITTLVAATLNQQEIGSLAESPVAMAPLFYAQELTAMPGRVSRAFVQVKPGQERRVAKELGTVAEVSGVNIEPSDFDSKLFDVASNPETQSETLFSVISALVGFLFAFTAILVTVPRRRRYIEELWPHGAGVGITLEVLLFDAFVLALLGCTLGLALGDVLSAAAFNRAPNYLTSAFPVGNSRIVSLRSVALAVLAGTASAAGGVLWPMREVLVGTSKRRWYRRWANVRLLVGIACVGVTAAVLTARPQDAFLGSVALVTALLALMPTAFHAVLVTFDYVQRFPRGGPATELTVDALRSMRVRVRALAVAVLSAVAVFGAVSIGGAEISLRRGLYSSARDVAFSANVWLSPGGEASPLFTSPFASALRPSTLRLPGVETIGVYRGSFFDWGSRRIWVMAPPENSKSPIPPSQLVSGQLARATARLREGGWAVLSEALAREHHLAVDDTFTLPSPVPTDLRVAALSTNLGWPPGAMILNATEYARAWGSGAPSAYEIQTRPGTSSSSVRRAMQQALGPSTGLAVETSGERRARNDAVIDQGLSRLTEIKLLVLIASALALAGAMTSLIWQRRERIAAIRMQGYSSFVLWRWLCYESLLILGTGCCMGALFGVVGQIMLSHALAVVTGFPIALGVEVTVVALSFLWAGAVASTIVTVPGSLAVQVSPRAVSAMQ